MISGNEFITMSLDINLLFLRIMKEHAFFLEIGFLPRDKEMAQKAKYFRECFESLLSEATDLSCGNVSHRALASNQFVTEYTVGAEELTNYYTQIPFNISITRKERTLSPNDKRRHVPESAVDSLNKRAYRLTAELIEFKEHVLQKVLTCKMFTFNYPLLIEHILREARLYLKYLESLLQRRGRTRDLINQEVFWNRQMAEHAEFIAGLLDPSEDELICASRSFGKEFCKLTEEAKNALRQTNDTLRVTKDSIEATKRLRDFKAAGTKGILECKVKSVIIPLIADHVLREANHYLCVMGECNTDCPK